MHNKKINSNKQAHLLCFLIKIFMHQINARNMEHIKLT